MRTERPLARTLEALREVRAHMRRTFPQVDHVEVHRILANRGISRYPDALMLVQPEGIELPKRSAPWRRDPPPSPPRLRKGRPLPLFSEAYYRLANADLRDLDLSMVLHWQVHGRLEGRSPHPFIDLGWLSAQISDALPGEVVDVYLTDRTRWLATPSPYVETEAFMLSGPWDGVTHPLLQIIRDYPVDPWLRGRLGVIDLAEADDELQMAAGVLTARNPGLAQLSPFSVFEPSAVPEDLGIGPASFRVVPGFVLAVGDQLIATPGDEVISGDGTAVRLADRVVVLDARDAVVCDTLVFVTSTLDLPALERLARDAVGGTLVAPFDSDQQKVLERLGVATLPHSRQVTVDAGSVELVGRPS
jgi:hypothetical protein